MALQIVRYVLTWPRFLGWLFPLLMTAIGLAHHIRIDEDAILCAQWRPWFAKKTRYSIALAAGIVLHPEVMEAAWEHERVHVRQFEDLTLAGLVLGLIVWAATDSPWAMVLWPGAMLLLTAGYLGALLRGGHAYYDAEHERSAYAQTLNPRFDARASAAKTPPRDEAAAG